MGLRISTNTTAIGVHRNVSRSDHATSRSLERLSSGFRINRAADDAAGLAVTEGLRSRIGGLTQALRNARDGVNVVQTAEGALDQSASILRRMRDLAVQAANRSAPEATSGIQSEIGQLTRELTRIAEATTFNGTRLLDGRYDGRFQVGPSVGDTIPVSIGTALGASGLGLGGLDVTRVVDPEVRITAAQGRVEAPRAGALVFSRATVAADGIAALAGDITVDGKTVSFGPGSYAGNADAVAQLNAAASAAGLTYRPDPFVDDGDDLVFFGPLPTSGADLTAASPVFTPAVGAAASTGPLSFAARDSIGPTPGLIEFPGSSAADLATFRGSISAGGHTLDLGSVTYVDTSGDGAISGAEALQQLNAAARDAGITDRDDAFAETRLTMLGDHEYAEQGIVLFFRGPVPADDATSAELEEASPVFTEALDPIVAIDRAIAAISSQRAELGAIQNRLEHTIDNVSVSIENTTAAVSRIRDTDMAREMTAYTSSRIVAQAGISLLAQANSSATSVLSLLRG